MIIEIISITFSTILTLISIFLIYWVDLKNRKIQKNVELNESLKILNEVNINFQKEIFDINLNISDILSDFQKDYLMSYSFNDEVEVQFEKLNTNVSKKIFKLRLQLSTLFKKLLLDLNKLLPIKKNLIYNYYRNKFVWEKYSKLYTKLDLEVTSEGVIEFNCYKCEEFVNIEENFETLVAKISTLIDNLCNIKNVSKSYTKDLEEIYLEVDSILTELNFGIILSVDRDFYLKDLFYIKHKNCVSKENEDEI
ncbi:hypothetical protein [Spiroplasma floricola]|uniref:Uncharacterized protein n=1 Tax=Spiroplasma floricola 23-6 TaxID=1336749 RepID=A0A2K8SEH4_9MOLU|nr:hypothetical protein [Spiroplasma floricola]AUB31240.1 hypothetical protein SFLOR_v1c01790 [Spiroplasma floricola 23-6]